jgi:hypothetical protein
MGKDRFKEGDRVFDIRYGWGHIADSREDLRCVVYFDDNKNPIWFDEISSRILSFTEYALNGYTSYRPEILPKIGQVVWVRDELPSEWTIGHFFKKENGKYYISYSPSLKGWNTNGTEIKTINPYKNEQ